MNDGLTALALGAADATALVDAAGALDANAAGGCAEEVVTVTADEEAAADEPAASLLLHAIEEAMMAVKAATANQRWCISQENRPYRAAMQEGYA